MKLSARQSATAPCNLNQSVSGVALKSIAALTVCSPRSGEATS
jgi:hypothetical protein